MPNHPTKRWWHSKTLINRLSDLGGVAAKNDSLVMSISHPRDCANGSENDGNGRYRTNDENRFRIDKMVSEIIHSLQDKPANTGKCTTTVNASY
jgi:hypothetical protein